jgi:hypothetical protein
MMTRTVDHCCPAFPTEGLVPERRQIGRLPAIEGLERRLLDPGHWALIDRRRFGKSSVANAALTRVRGRSKFVTISIDLRQLRVGDELELVKAMRQGAANAGIDHQVTGKVARNLKELLKGQGPSVVKEVSNVLGLPAEVGDATLIAQTLGGLLGGDQLPDLAQQLGAFEAWAMAHERCVVLFIDEVQQLAGWHDGATVEGLSRAMRLPLRRVRLLFAGSETTSMRELFAPGRPLREHTNDFDLPDIARADWLHHLPDRFNELGFTVDPAALEAALDASPGLPLRTNQICFQAVTSAPEYGFDDHVNEAVMRYAIGLVRKRDEWEDPQDA